MSALPAAWTRNTLKQVPFAERDLLFCVEKPIPR